MPLNVKAARALQKDINKSAGGGDDLYLYSSKLGEEEDIRIMPPTEEMNGIYFLTQYGWWINGQFYTSNETFGKECVIKDEIEAAREDDDEDG